MGLRPENNLRGGIVDESYQTRAANGEVIPQSSLFMGIPVRHCDVYAYTCRRSLIT